MIEIEQRLREEKARLDVLSAPQAFEARLRNALNAASPRSRSKRMNKSGWIVAASVLAIALFACNQYHALAYYGKTLLGFDGVVNGTLGQLNEQGKGQRLDERTVMADGTVLSIEGIMSDENQLILYYSLKQPGGVANEDAISFMPIGLDGFRTDAKMQTGASGPNGAGTEIQGMMSFEPVSPLAKKLTLTYWEDLPGSGESKKSRMTFPYHPDEALQTKIEQPIQETITIDDVTMTFESITATPTMTLIEGTLRTEDDKRMNVIHRAELIANGAEVAKFRSEARRAEDGMAFTLKYDALPDDLSSLRLEWKESGDVIRIPLK